MLQNHQIDTINLPKVETVDLLNLTKEAKLEAMLSFAIVALPLSLAASISIYLFAHLPLAVYSLIQVFIIVLFSFSLWWRAKGVELTGFALREHDFVLKEGVLWRELTIVPFNRIQHIESHRSPIERKLGLTTIKLYTAGGSGDDLKLSGVEMHQAEQIKQYILSAITQEAQHEH